MNIYKKYIKRILDFIAALIALLVLLVPIMIMAIFIAVKTRGNPFFFQNRPGLNGRVFKLIKFQTMTDARDDQGNLLPDTERITKLGAFFRKTSLDELPSLINVLKGDISLVGPRPLLVKYLPYYTPRENRRHEVRPGFTGLAQISGRHRIMWDERLAMDVQYVENVSFLLDCKIIWATFVQVLKQKDVLVVSSDFMPDFDHYRQSR
jgi:undecaprenyl phosphate N,N'-diacetylbacillosamine 1-phosphate transferase